MLWSTGTATLWPRTARLPARQLLRKDLLLQPSPRRWSGRRSSGPSRLSRSDSQATSGTDGPRSTDGPTTTTNRTRKNDHCLHLSASLDLTTKRTAKSGQLGRGTLSSRMLATRSLLLRVRCFFRPWHDQSDNHTHRETSSLVLARNHTIDMPAVARRASSLSLLTLFFDSGLGAWIVKRGGKSPSLSALDDHQLMPFTDLGMRSKEALMARSKTHHCKYNSNLPHVLLD